MLSPEGFESYYRAIGFADGKCLNVSANDTQKANLGDGNGKVPQAGLARWENGCAEALQGGNHFRYWFQNGTKANTKAVFIAASVEQPIKKDHMVVSNGYDLGRDQLVGNATQSTKTDKETGNQFETKVIKKDKSLLKGISSDDLNHNIGTDGTVTVLQVQLVQHGHGPEPDDSSAQLGQMSFMPSFFCLGLAAVLTIVPIMHL